MKLKKQQMVIIGVVIILIILIACVTVVLNTGDGGTSNGEGNGDGIDGGTNGDSNGDNGNGNGNGGETGNWINLSSDINTVATDCGLGYTDYSDIFFIDENEGWVTSSCVAEIYHTIDGGITWEVQNTQYPTNAIWMLNKNEGYAGGENGRIYHTIDGGITWDAIGSIGVHVVDMFFQFNGDMGYACGDSGAIYCINDQNVNSLSNNLVIPLKGISSPSNNNIWVCGGSSIYYTNGDIFIEQPSPTGSFNSIYFINENEGWVVGDSLGDSAVIGRTINGGNNWAVQDAAGTNSLFDIFFLDSNSGWSVGFEGTIIQTTNGGTTWTIEGEGLTDSFLTGVHAPSSKICYVCGNKGTLLKYVEEG